MILVSATAADNDVNAVGKIDIGEEDKHYDVVEEDFGYNNVSYSDMDEKDPGKAALEMHLMKTTK